MAGFALSIGYNIPELVGQAPLVLDLYTVSLIYTGDITHWNDTRIQEYTHHTPSAAVDRAVSDSRSNDLLDVDPFPLSAHQPQPHRHASRRQHLTAAGG
jgi:hypothetical protein